MNIDEAIKHAREVADKNRLANRKDIEHQTCEECAKEHEQLSEWLEELQQYRSIGTVEECREAVERQKAKIPDVYGDGYSDGQLVYDMYTCPNCGENYEIDYDHYDYCPKCGQHMDKNDKVLNDWRDIIGKDRIQGMRQMRR